MDNGTALGADSDQHTPPDRDEVRAVTFDAEQLDSVPAGRRRRHLPGDPRRPGLLARRPAEPADLPAHGGRPGRGRRGHPVRGRRARPRARLRGAGRDPRRGWSDDQLVRGAPGHAARRLAGDARRRRVGDRGRRRVALPARAAVGAGDPARGGDLAHRRGRGVLGAARRAAAPPPLGHARGRVRAQRRPHRRPGHPGLLGRPARAGRGRDGRHGRSRAGPSAWPRAW